MVHRGFFSPENHLVIPILVAVSTSAQHYRQRATLRLRRLQQPPALFLIVINKRAEPIEHILKVFNSILMEQAVKHFGKAPLNHRKHVELLPVIRAVQHQPWYHRFHRLQTFIRDMTHLLVPLGGGRHMRKHQHQASAQLGPVGLFGDRVLPRSGRSLRQCP